MDTLQALEHTKAIAPQKQVELVRGMTLRRTQGTIAVTRIHYSANPERDPDINPEWKRVERAAYSSQAAWDREQEIRDEAGGGELVFADTLISHWNKIVITDPTWRPDPRWRVDAGFDHGKTNATAFGRCYVDYDGVQYFCGEYYQPGKEIWEHAPVMKSMADYENIGDAYADPTIFPQIMQQSQSNGPERAKSVNDLYVEAGVSLLQPFAGDRSDISFAARLMLHWSNLGPADYVLKNKSPEERAEMLKEYRKPTVRIVCRNYSDKPQFGLHDWDSPNLLWELMRTRRVKLSAQQLLSRNAAEAIVDKDNHARDYMKYTTMSLPAPSKKTPSQIAAEEVQGLDPTSAMIRYQQVLAREESKSNTGSVALGRRGLMNARRNR